MVQKLDSKDLKLVYWMNKDAKLTSKRLAYLLNTSREVVEYRFKRLKEQNIIKKQIALVNTSILGYDSFLLLLELQNYSPAKEVEISEKIKNHSNTKWLIKCTGHWDLQVAITARDRKELKKVVDEITLICSETLRSYDFTYNIEFLKKENLGFLIDKEYKSEYKKSKKLKLKAKDELLLKLLAYDSKTTFLELANKTGLNVETVKSRIKHLTDAKVIVGHQMIVDLSRIGYLNHYIFMRINDLSETLEASIKTFFETLPAVVFVERLLGAWDLRIQVVAEDINIFEQTLQQIREFLSEHLTSYESCIMLEELKRNSMPEGVVLEV